MTDTTPTTTGRRRLLPRRLGLWLSGLFAGLVVILAALFGMAMWDASSQILFPKGPGDVGSLTNCRELTQTFWGPDCGRFTDRPDVLVEPVEVASPNGYTLSAHLLKSPDATASTAVLYTPGGGSDRREASRYVDIFRKLGADILAIDPVCHGLSPCPVPGVSFGAREAIDVAAAAKWLGGRYDRVVVMGSSIGAVASLRALPNMPGVTAIIAENPFLSIERLLRDAREAQGMPDIMVSALAQTVRWRGGFPTVPEANEVMASSGEVPVLIIHSKADQIVPVGHSEALAGMYGGPVETWFPENGGHGAIWNAGPAAYENRLRAFLAPLL